MTEDKKPKKVACRKCGAEFATPGQIKVVSGKLGSSPEYLDYCPACKRARLAEQITKTADGA